MNGFFLLLGHLLGDYILQNDWQAKYKTMKRPGKRPGVTYDIDGSPILDTNWDLAARLKVHDAEMLDWWTGHLACTVHCLLYTLSVAACSFWWMPWWGYLIVFGAHWPIDRFRLAGVWMRNVSGQSAFAGAFSPPNLPWGVIIVDQCFHLATLGAIAGVLMAQGVKL